MDVTATCMAWTVPTVLVVLFGLTTMLVVATPARETRAKVASAVSASATRASMAGRRQLIDRGATSESSQGPHNLLHGSPSLGITPAPSTVESRCIIRFLSEERDWRV
jgi:hypothetical protein